MPFSFKDILGGVAAGWDDPGYAGKELSQKRLKKFSADLEDQQFKNRLTTASRFARQEEGETADDIASGMVSRGDIDEVTGKPISQGAAYRKALETINTAKAEQPLESAYRALSTASKMPSAGEVGRLSGKEDIARRLQAISASLLGSEQAESERPLVPVRAASLKERMMQEGTAASLQRGSDVAKIAESVPQLEAARDASKARLDYAGTEADLESNVPRISSATRASQLAEAGNIARANVTQGLPMKTAAARAADLDEAEQTARQNRITSALNQDSQEALKKANNIIAKSKLTEAERAALPEKFMKARTDPNNANLSEEEKAIFDYLQATGSLDSFIKQSLNIYRPFSNPMMELTAGIMGGSGGRYSSASPYNPMQSGQLNPQLMKDLKELGF